MNDSSKNINNSDLPPTAMTGLRKKLKYGSVAVIFTAIFIAVAVILNIVTMSIHVARPMIVDMTTNQIYGISDATRELLADVTAPVEIVFFRPLDLYEKENGAAGTMIVNCVKTYTTEYPNITIRIEDLIKNPGVKLEFVASAASSISQYSVVVTSGGTSRILGRESFFAIASSTNAAMGFRGELMITSSILQVTDTDYPIIYFTTGHSESAPEALLNLFTSAGFTVKAIDLTKEDIEENAKIIVICNPQKDFIGASSGTEKSEVDKIASFLNNFGNVMYFTSPDVGALPEIEDLLKEYGIAFEHNTIVTDPKNSLKVSDTRLDGVLLDTEYYESGTAGDELTASIRKLPSKPKTIVPLAKPIKILDVGNVSENSVSPVLKSFDTAYLVSESEIISNGTYDLLVLANKTRYVDNNPKTSLLLACGSTYFLDTNYLGNASYSNSDIILNALRIMANRKIAVDIRWKEFDDNKLIMTLDEQNNWTLITILVLPAIVIVLGIIVWLRRRHS